MILFRSYLLKIRCHPRLKSFIYPWLRGCWHLPKLPSLTLVGGSVHIPVIIINVIIIIIIIIQYHSTLSKGSDEGFWPPYYYHYYYHCYYHYYYYNHAQYSIVYCMDINLNIKLYLATLDFKYFPSNSRCPQHYCHLNLCKFDRYSHLFRLCS